MSGETAEQVLSRLKFRLENLSLRRQARHEHKVALEREVNMLETQLRDDRADIAELEAGIKALELVIPR